MLPPYRPRVRRVLPLLLLPLLAACGQATPAPAAASTDPAALLAGVTAAAEAAGSVTYASVTETALDGGEPEVGGRLTGALDLTSDGGTGRVELPDLAELAGEAGAAGEASASADLGALADLTLSWTATDVTAVIHGERHTAPRTSDDDGVIARVPAEPAGLFDAVTAATGATVVGQEEVEGVATTRLRAQVEPQAAVEAGLGTQGQLSIATLPALPVEVWVDVEGRPARIRYTAEVPSLQGRTRTLTTTYDYRAWGKPVDVTP